MILLPINQLIKDEELQPITSSVIKIGGKLNPDGLFSTRIFGNMNSARWRSTKAYIDLRQYILHPLLYEIADRRCSLLLKFFKGEMCISKGRLIKGMSGGWGIPFFIKNLKSVIGTFVEQGGVTDASKQLLSFILNNKEYSFVNKQIVIPPQFRPFNEEFRKIELSPIDDSYVKILNIIPTIKMGDQLNAQDAMNIHNLQLAVYECYKIHAEFMKGKQGIQRKSLLGKTLDFSARAVITSDPDMKPDCIGLPFAIAVTLFKPFVIYECKANPVIQEKLLKANIQPKELYLNRLLDSIKEKAAIPIEVKEIITEAVNNVMSKKLVLAKRDPVLHRLGIRAFRPVIINDDSFHISALVCSGYNADFDGDQMAVFLPISTSSQEEIKKMLPSNDFFAPNGDSVLSFDKEIILGLYYLSDEPDTNNKSVVPVKDQNDIINLIRKTGRPTMLISYRNVTNTAGRVLLEIVSGGVKIKKQLKKKDMNDLIMAIYNLDPTTAVDRCHAVSKLAFWVPTVVGKSLSPLTMLLSEEQEKQKADILKSADPSVGLDQLTKDYIANNKGSLVYDFADSGAGIKGGLVQVQSVIVSKGYVANSDGKTIERPITGSMNDGLTSDEYFIASEGGRKGLIDRSQMTANSGYLTRQFIYASNSVIIDPTVVNCKTRHFLQLFVADEKMGKQLNGRYLSNGTMITNGESLTGQTIQIYSPIYCASPGLCQTCLPKSITNHLKTKNVGFVAAQLIGERGTQLSMRTFHCFEGGNTVLLKYLNEIGQYTIKNIWDDHSNNYIKSINNQEEIDISNKNILVYDNDAWTKVKKIIKHKRNPDSNMVFMKMLNNHFIVSQDNHPISINENGSNIFVEPKDIIVNKHEGIISNNIWQSNIKQPFTDPYLIGIFLGNGCVRHSYSNNDLRYRNVKPRSIIISEPETKYNGEIRNKIIEIFGNICKDNTISIQDDAPKSLHIHNGKLAESFHKYCGRYSYAKHLPPDYIHYSDSNLSLILAGLIDSDGMIVKNNSIVGSQYVKIELSSIALIYQIKMICDKLGIRTTINSTTVRTYPHLIKGKSISKKHHSYTIEIRITNEQRTDILKNSVLCQYLKLNKKVQNRRYNITSTTFTKIKEILWDEEDYVYDLETESHTLSVNGIQVHNSGGASSLTNLADEDPELVNLIKQDSTDVISLVPLKVYISMDDAKELAEETVVKSLRIESNNISVNIDVLYDIIVLVNDSMEVKKLESEWEISVEADTVFISMSNATQDITDAVKLIVSTLSNKHLSIEKTLHDAYEIYSLSVSTAIWAWEIICSQLIRNPLNPVLPYRLSDMKEPPLRIGLKDVSIYENWKRAAAFENTSKALHSQILNPNQSGKSNVSDLDDLLKM